MTIQQILQWAQSKLAPLIEQPLLDAEILLAAVLNKPRAYLRAWSEVQLTAAQQALFESYINRRLKYEPVAYILGHKEFWSLDFLVNQHTLIPRPETELLVETILNLYPANEIISLADLGTGSGAIAIALAHERPHWKIYATDVSENALQIASKNAQRLQIKNVSFHRGSWCTALPSVMLDVIVSNPPYIAETEWELYAEKLQFEPQNALLSGKDGLDDIREICQSANIFLKEEGLLLIEHGYNQACAVQQVLALSGYRNVDSVRDLAGLERITLGKRHF